MMSISIMQNPSDEWNADVINLEKESYAANSDSS